MTSLLLPFYLNITEIYAIWSHVLFLMYNTSTIFNYTSKSQSFESTGGRPA